MHPHSDGRHEPARGARLRAVALAGLCAVTLAGAFLPGAPASGAPSLAYTAAESPRGERAPEQKPPVRRKPRAPRDMPFGREGDPRKATRTVRIEMSDTMRYFPNQVTVKKGQTVRFNVHNAGELQHEMVIGTMDDLKKYAETMRRHGEIAHDDANVAQVMPGQAGRIVWQFTRAGEFYYGCFVPGHFDAGMIGTIVVR